MRVSGTGSIETIPGFTTNGNVLLGKDLVSGSDHAFLGGGKRGNVAGKYSGSQLLNPASSGVLVLIDSINIAAGSTSDAMIYLYNTALSFSAPGTSCLDLSTDSTATINFEASSSLLGTLITRYRLQADTQYFVPMDYPIILSEGIGLVVWGDTINMAIYASFNWREITL